MGNLPQKTRIIILSITSFLLLAAIIATFVFWRNVPIFIVNLLVWGVLLCLGIHFLVRNPIAAPEVANTLSRRWFWLIYGLILVVGCIVRVVLFGIVPGGLNPDEASMLYDAYSLGKFGVDRNGASFPVYMEAWGHGQNTLLTYLTIPFVLVFGMNAFSARIVSLIFSLISLCVFYYFVKKLTDNQVVALVCFVLFALCPYSIMIARWGLESNLFPHLLLYGMIFLVKTYRDHPGYIFPACLLFGLSLYSYAISYLVIPLLLFGFYVYLIVQKRFTKSSIALFVSANLILFVMALPLILFIVVNHGWLPDLRFGVFSITKMRGFRADEVSLANVGLSLVMIAGMLFGQTDYAVHNSPFNLGFFYLITVPFMVWGMIKTARRLFREKCQFCDFILCLWFCVSLGTGLLLKYPNVNKVNSLWFIVIIFISIGICDFAQNNRTVWLTLSGCLAVLFVAFCSMYFTVYNTNVTKNAAVADRFNDGLLASIAYAKTVTTDHETIYFSQGIREPYIYCLIVDEKSPDEFLQTRQFAGVSEVVAYGRYVFQNEIKQIETGKVYVIPLTEFDKQGQFDLPVDGYRIFGNFAVVTLH